MAFARDYVAAYHEKQQDVMNERKANQAKTKQPHEVVADPAMSKVQKKAALDTLEQDARQLSAAAAEGMTGGEPTGLRAVLNAKDSLELRPTAYAYDVVLQDLRSRLKTDGTGDARTVVKRAIAALEAATRPPMGADHGSNSIGDPKPGSAEEIDAELALERLDP